MIPCLYHEAELSFTTNGIGKLCDTVSCSVTEKRNGSYELKMSYPADGLHAEELAEGALILAKPSERADPQPFRIYKTTTPLTGVLEIAARHIQYQENYITVSPFTAEGSQAAMAQLKGRATTDCPFSFWTDIDSSAVFSILVPATVRNCLGGMDGSILDTYGGEYEWDFLTARLHKQRGSDHGVRIVYGKNLIDFQMEKSVENVITGVHPYWKSSEGNILAELPEKVVMASGRALGYEKVTPLDCSSQFENQPTEEQLRSYAAGYLKSTSLTEPNIDIKIDFLQLWQTPGYADIAAAERVSLCDTVHVYIAKMGIEVSCKVTETEYDVLLERYKSITLSNASVYSRNSSLTGSLENIKDEAQQAIETAGRVEIQGGADTKVLKEKLEKLRVLAAGLFGLYTTAGETGDGNPVLYAHTGETLAESKVSWMAGNSGFFVSTDGGKSWAHGFGQNGEALHLAVEAAGLSADALVDGVLRTSRVKILGTEHFFWEKDAITLADPEDEKRLIRIGRYGDGEYGIVASTDGGSTWQMAVGFDGIPWEDAPKEETPVIQGERITKSETVPTSPETDDLWIDKSVTPMLLKLWDGEAWQVVGYTPQEEPPTDPETPEDPEPSTDPDASGEDTSGSEDTGDPDGSGGSTETTDPETETDPGSDEDSGAETESTEDAAIEETEDTAETEEGGDGK